MNVAPRSTPIAVGRGSWKAARMSWRQLFAGALISILTTACWSRTDTVTAAHAEAGETGFGVSNHTHTAYMVLAAVVATVTASANVAMVESEPSELPTDSVWQAYAGGRKVRHCFVVQGGRHICADAALDEPIGWGSSLVFIDPVNLGSFLQQVQSSWTDLDRVYYVQASAGSVETGSGIRMPLGPNHGVWGLLADTRTIMHCQLEKSQPRCRRLPPDFSILGSDITFLDGVLGVFSNPEEDILWIAKPLGVFRCTASGNKPDPQCVAAKMQ